MKIVLRVVVAIAVMSVAGLGLLCLFYYDKMVLERNRLKTQPARNKRHSKEPDVQDVEVVSESSENQEQNAKGTEEV